MRRHWREVEDAELFAAELVAVAVGAMNDGFPPALSEAGKLGQNVAHSEGEEQPGSGHRLAILQRHPKTIFIVSSVHGFQIAELHGRIGRHLSAHGFEHGLWVTSVLGKKAVGGGSEAITRRAYIEHQ